MAADEWFGWFLLLSQYVLPYILEYEAHLFLSRMLNIYNNHVETTQKPHCSIDSRHFDLFVEIALM